MRWPQRGLPAGEFSVMVQRITLFRIVSFCLLAACGASCQSEPALASELRGAQSRGTDEGIGVGRPFADAPLPDAPMPNEPTPGAPIPGTPARVLTPADSFRLAGAERRLPFSAGIMAANVGVSRETHVADAASLLPSNGLPLSSGALFHRDGDRAVPAEKGISAFLGKYLYPPAHPGSRYQASSSDQLMGRATDAASRIFWTRDASGTRRLNTLYLLRVATAMAAHTASRPSWRRSASTPFSDFGSKIGNDAGMNLFHEFVPGLQHHLPKFAGRIEERILQLQKPH